jgi:hypothetical protein
MAGAARSLSFRKRARPPLLSPPSPVRVCELPGQASIPPAPTAPVAVKALPVGHLPAITSLGHSVGHVQLYLGLKPQSRRRKRSGGTLLDLNSFMQEFACQFWWLRSPADGLVLSAPDAAHWCGARGARRGKVSRPSRPRAPGSQMKRRASLPVAGGRP